MIPISSSISIQFNLCYDVDTNISTIRNLTMNVIRVTETAVKWLSIPKRTRIISWWRLSNQLLERVLLRTWKPRMTGLRQQDFVQRSSNKKAPHTRACGAFDRNYLFSYKPSCLKKSVPLSSTRMKAGKFSTSIFQTASIPSSGKSIHSTFLMFSSANSAAGPPIEPR